MIQFGTSGWRSIMAEEFTFANVRRVVGAIGDLLTQSSPAGSGGGSMGPRQGRSGATMTSKPVIVGYDSRFLSPEFAREAAGVLVKKGLKVLFSQECVPTPVVSFSIRHHQALGGINITASHNPAEYNGIKFNSAEGAPANPEMTHDIERRANQAPDAAPVHLTAEEEKRIQSFDPRPAYLAALKRVVNVSVLKKAKLRVGVDLLYGTGRGYLDAFFQSAGCRTQVLHDRRDVTFGGQAPEPAAPQLAELITLIRKEKLVAGFGTDGDADRFGVLDEDGTLLSPNEILPIVLQHLVKTRMWKGFVMRSVMTSHFIDAVARYYNLPVKETPVGFKYIAEGMKSPDFLMGGEESGGLTIRGHVPEKDGILACALMAEVRAVEKRSYKDILRVLRKQVGAYLSNRINLHLSDAAMQQVRRRFETLTPNALGGLAVKKIVRLDGFKFIFQDDSWMGVRLSGTEPVVRLYLEAASPRQLKDLEKIGTQLIQQH